MLNIVKEWFIYIVNKMFSSLNDKAQQLSARVAQALPVEEGVKMIDKYAISDDEQDTVIEKMKEGAGKVFQYFSKLTFGITSAVAITDASVILKIKKEGGGNANIPKQIDLLMEEALVRYILMEWFSMKGNPDQAKYQLSLYVEKTREIVRSSADLRKPSI